MNERRKTTRVFHAVRPQFAGFHLVAEVETDDPSEAFLLTNTVEQEWWLNVGVHACVTPCRSTSVGDVIVLPNDDVLVVQRIGFGRFGKN